jgi:hypothetical protein
MGKDKKHRKRDAEDFLRYSGNEMSAEERNIFEKDLQKDAFDAEAMEGLSSVTPDEAREDLTDLNQRLSERIRHKNRFIFYRIAAAVVAIIIIGSLILMITKTGLFPDQVALTESGKQKSSEAMPEAEIIKHPGIKKPALGEEVTRTDISTDIYSDDQSITTKQHTELVPESVETGVSFEMQEPEGITETAVTAGQKETEMTEELREIIGKEETAQMVTMDETIKVNYSEEPAPPLSSRKARSAGKGDMLSGKPATSLVRGVVVSSEDNLPIPGAVVTVKGTSAGTVTDREGNFEIALRNDTLNTLVADFIGMESKEIKLTDEENINITLEPSESSLDEVVVVGYGIQKKRNISGAISTIKLDDDANYQSASPVTGYDQFREYIKNNLQYPPGHTTGTREVVVLSFIVDKDRRPSDIFVLKSPGKKFSEEAIRLLKNGPDWFSAKREGVGIEEETRIRIVFRPDY